MAEKYFRKFLLDSTINAESYGDYVVRLIKFYLEKIRKYIMHAKTTKKPITNEPEAIRQLQNIELVIRHLEINLKKITSPKAIILCL